MLAGRSDRPRHRAMHCQSLSCQTVQLHPLPANQPAPTQPEYTRTVELATTKSARLDIYRPTERPVYLDPFIRELTLFADDGLKLLDAVEDDTVKLPNNNRGTTLN